jgi:hypothetical protein
MRQLVETVTLLTLLTVMRLMRQTVMLLTPQLVETALPGQP